MVQARLTSDIDTEPDIALLRTLGILYCVTLSALVVVIICILFTLMNQGLKMFIFF